MRVGKLSGAVGNYAATDPELERIACERLGLEPAPASTQILQRDRHAAVLAALAVAAASLEKFALEIRHLARTEVREVEEPFGAGPEGLIGDAAQAQPGRRPSGSAGSPASFAARRWSASRTSRSGTSGTSRTRRPSGSCFRTRSSRSTTCSTASPGSPKGSSSAPSRCGATSTPSHGLFFSQRVLLALVAAGLGRDEAYRLVQRNAMRAWDEETDFRGSRRVRSRDHRRPRRPARSTRRSTSPPTPATWTPSSSGSAPSPQKEEPIHA